MLYHLNRFLMGLKMSDEIDTDMIEEWQPCLLVGCPTGDCAAAPCRRTMN